MFNETSDIPLIILPRPLIFSTYILTKTLINCEYLASQTSDHKIRLQYTHPYPPLQELIYQCLLRIAAALS